MEEMYNLRENLLLGALINNIEIKIMILILSVCRFVPTRVLDRLKEFNCSFQHYIMAHFFLVLILFQMFHNSKKYNNISILFDKISTK